MKRFLKILGIVIGSCAALYLIVFVINLICASSLRSYIRSFDPVDYSDTARIVPVMEDGYYTFTTDEDLRIMYFTDIHIGGGFWSYKRDKKAVDEIISMMRIEKPDLVLLGGDNTYCLPGFGWNGGFTFNNANTARTVATIFDHSQVYFSLVFGNHDTEAMDYSDRQSVADIYMDPRYEYCIFDEMYTDLDAATKPSVTNQFILLKGTDGHISKILLLLDSNDYMSTSLADMIGMHYDVVHDAQVYWARDRIKELSAGEGLPDGEALKALLFMHIPVGEFRTALDDLIEETTDERGNTVYSPKKDPGPDTVFVKGAWDDDKVYYGGLGNGIPPEKEDILFEVLCEQEHMVEGIFTGHDHLNNVAVNHKGVYLCYNMSVDNSAYKGIAEAGLQRGCSIITVKPSGEWTHEFKNAYIDYGLSTEKYGVYLDRPLHPEWYRTWK